jgi:hypothetical protein
MGSCGRDNILFTFWSKLCKIVMSMLIFLS